MDLKDLSPDTPPKRRSRARLRLRNSFLTGIVVAAPISITIYLTWAFVTWADGWVKPLIPSHYNPDTYLPFSVPGVGLVLALVAITLLGFLTANLVGRTIVSYGELLLERMPLVRSLYKGLKQLFEAALSQSGRSFQQVGLIEYPRLGLWSLVFIATDARGEVADRLGAGEDVISVYLPTTPNPTAGYLLFVPRRDVIVLDMSVQDAAKLIISGGLVAPEHSRQVPPVAEEHPPLAAE